ncbi:hypothetical protein [Solwaraspora sp. WMMA2065]|uniref:hypothetical protein n=1 Tax=Solwaraspora sp. WMMA2065 TaxID=3015166 RepID=UPI00259B2CF9|nr:hypothetical protein [Solwaraspora sp. WMMA2065]WJK33109.1 hypothetical protein O7610_20635 [Solwaraspora sp. WMMA2065]
MSRLQPGDILSYDEMGQLLDLDPADHTGGRQAIHAAARKAAEVLLTRHRTVFTVARGRGYQHARPDQVLDLAHRHQARAVAEVTDAHTKVGTIDLTRLDVTAARLVQATATGLAHQTAMMRQLDVRQNRLDTAMAALQQIPRIGDAQTEPHQPRPAPGVWDRRDGPATYQQPSVVSRVDPQVTELDTGGRGTPPPISSPHPEPGA